MYCSLFLVCLCGCPSQRDMDDCRLWCDNGETYFVVCPAIHWTSSYELLVHVWLWFFGLLRES